MPNDLVTVFKDAARLAEATARAVSNGDMEEAARLQGETEAAWAKARRLGQRATQRPNLSKVPSVRERAVSTLLELCVPCSPRTIAAYSEARTGEPFDLKAIASIRRDERRSWSSGSRRHTFLVPALEGPWLAAGRGSFCLSNWTLEQRIIGPLSPRVDHLKVCLSVLAQIESAVGDGGLIARMRALFAEYVRSVPGALTDPWSKGPDIEISRARDAILVELKMIQSDDEKSRRQEAERATRTLDEEQQLWGGSPPRIVGGSSA